MKSRCLSLLATVLLSAAPFAQEPAPAPAPPGEFDARLEAALADLALRDPDASAALQRALASNPAAALARLQEHARYLDELAAAAATDPEKHRLMLEQEQAEARTRAALEQLQEAPNAEREQRAATLRRTLEDWFEIRHALRAHHLQGAEAGLAAQRQRVESAARDAGAQRESWLRRVTAGGSAAMRSRLAGGEAEHGELEALAPFLVERLVAEDPTRGRALAELARTNPEELSRALQHLAAERPDLLEHARRARAPELERHRALRAAIQDAHRALVPLAEETERSGGAAAELTTAGLPEPGAAALEALVRSESALNQAQLARAEAELQRARSVLEERRHRKPFIVELQLARMLGRAEVYAW